MPPDPIRPDRIDRFLSELADAESASAGAADRALQARGLDPDALHETGLRRLDELMAAHAEPAPLTDLVEAARAAGLDLRALARQLDLSLALVAQLNRRLLRAATVPRSLIERLAAAIGRETSAVAAFLAGTPTLVAGTQYRSDAAPKLSEPVAFADAVKSDLSLTPQQRTAWLAAD